MTIFVEEMTHLCRRADLAMAEEKKLRFPMRGFKQELFAGLIRNLPKTVSTFLTKSMTIEKALEMWAMQ